MTKAGCSVLLESSDTESPSMINSAVFNTLRILKKVNQGDTYLENYLGHYHRHKEKFFDHYHLAWIWGSKNNPKRIFEVGTRTGLSLCQLLSSLMDRENLRVVTCDLFNDGYVSVNLVLMYLKYLNLPTDCIEFLIGDSKETIPKFKTNHVDEKFDWVLVDGGHDRETAKADLANVWELVDKNGILVFDDISTNPGECGLIDVWDEFKGCHPNEFTYFEDFNGKGTAWGIKK